MCGVLYNIRLDRSCYTPAWATTTSSNNNDKLTQVNYELPESKLIKLSILVQQVMISMQEECK